ncbi:hypothetical protein Droror1_Dr00023341 [Drosera rotundifolia]
MIRGGDHQRGRPHPWPELHLRKKKKKKKIISLFSFSSLFYFECFLHLQMRFVHGFDDVSIWEGRGAVIFLVFLLVFVHLHYDIVFPAQTGLVGSVFPNCTTGTTYCHCCNFDCSRKLAVDNPDYCKELVQHKL